MTRIQPSQTAGRRTYLKEVTIERSSYYHSHAREPRGYGSWAFAPTHAEQGWRPERGGGKTYLPPEEARAQLDALTILIERSTYTAAAKTAKTIFASQGITEISVLP